MPLQQFSLGWRRYSRNEQTVIALLGYGEASFVLASPLAQKLDVTLDARVAVKDDPSGATRVIEQKENLLNLEPVINFKRVHPLRSLTSE